ncbi:MAG: hypothetical protein BWY87_00332 [Deltaproteobacteria bacterium ADurb.Bin510]|nr:MAG: hypothetical protein BWY87_00332 [Deltaproteobacteria bacterium ADurb.Bin510]
MRKFDRFVVIAVFIAAAVLPGCSSDTDRSASMQPNSATSEELIAEGEHPELARLLGYPTGDDVLALGGKALKRLNHLNESGLTTDSDYRSVVDMLERVYNLMVWYENPEHAGTLPEDEADELEEIALNEYMGLAAGSTEQQAYDKVTEAVGGGLQQMVSLVNHVDFYAMIEYLVMAGPVSYTDTSKQTISSDSPLHTALTGISVNGFEGEDDARQTEDQFKETIARLHRALNSTYTKLLPYLDGSQKKPAVLDHLITVNDLEQVAIVMVKNFVGVPLEEYEKVWYGPAADYIAGLVLDEFENKQGDASISVDLKALKPLAYYLFVNASDKKDAYALDAEQNSKPIVVYWNGFHTRQYESIDGKTDYITGAKIDFTAWHHANKVTYDNPFLRNLKTLLYEMLMIRNPQYNKNPEDLVKFNKATGAWTFTNALLTDKQGADGVYNLYPMVAALYDATDANSAAELWRMLAWIVDPHANIWYVLGFKDSLAADAQVADDRWPVTMGDVLGKNHGEGVISLPFVQSLFANVDYNKDGTRDGSFVAWLMGGIALDGDEREDGKDIDMTELLFELEDLAVERAESFKPGTASWQSLKDLLLMVQQTAVVD